MRFKTILVHLDLSPASDVRAALSACWARAHEAHLIGLVPTGLQDGVIPAGALATGMTDYIAQSADYLRRRAETIDHAFRERIAGPRPLSCEVRLSDGVAMEAVVRHGRTSDLLVLGRSDGADDRDIIAHGLAEHALMEAGRPVLVVPSPAAFDDVPRNVLLAWDGSREAAMAMQAALPALRVAARVTLLSLRHPGDEDRAQQLLVPDVVQYLLRHGVRAQAEAQVTGIGVADALLSRSVELAADLVVMGGYGHSRLRERVVGGVTRQVLAQAAVPVLMAH